MRQGVGVVLSGEVLPARHDCNQAVSQRLVSLEQARLCISACSGQLAGAVAASRTAEPTTAAGVAIPPPVPLCQLGSTQPAAPCHGLCTHRQAKKRLRLVCDGAHAVQGERHARALSDVLQEGVPCTQACPVSGPPDPSWPHCSTAQCACVCGSVWIRCRAADAGLTVCLHRGWRPVRLDKCQQHGRHHVKRQGNGKDSVLQPARPSKGISQAQVQHRWLCEHLGRAGGRQSCTRGRGRCRPTSWPSAGWGAAWAPPAAGLQPKVGAPRRLEVPGGVGTLCPAYAEHVKACTEHCVYAESQLSAHYSLGASPFAVLA